MFTRHHAAIAAAATAATASFSSPPAAAVVSSHDTAMPSAGRKRTTHSDDGFGPADTDAAASESAAADGAPVVKSKKPRQADKSVPEVCAAPSKSIAAAAAAPPRPVLYTDALLTVFSFLPLSALSRVLAVCHGWSHVVQHMPSRDATVIPEAPERMLLAVALSSLGRRHVGRIGTKCSKVSMWQFGGPAMLCVIAQNMPCVRELYAELRREPPLLLPSTLTTLHLFTFAPAQYVMKTVSKLHLLKECRLLLEATAVDLDFSVFRSMEHLTSLSFVWSTVVTWGANRTRLTATQIQQLRTMPYLTLMDPGIKDASTFTRLFHKPHQLQWAAVGMIERLNLERGQALTLLPSLTRLDAGRCEDLSCVALMPKLADLHIDANSPDGADAPWLLSSDAILVALNSQTCSRLTSLSLSAGLSSKDMCILMPRLSRLTSLHLMDMRDMDSLCFLQEGAITRTLTHLELESCRLLHPLEMRRLHHLRALTSLQIQICFSQPLDELSQANYRPPTVLIPSLRSFIYLFNRSRICSCGQNRGHSIGLDW
jgi:hypothetical protein